jgi:FtsP/CotA-like multicopper oxidase with cupredoxin domain
VTTTTLDLPRGRRRLRRLVAAAAGTVALAASAWWLTGLRASAEVREFRGSYAEDARPRGVVREVTLTAAPAVVPLLDGRPLAVWAYNGQVPGPILRMRLGETLRATLVNRLPQATTIHWHGVRVPNAMDGSPGVTQPPVAPGETFLYEFTPKDAGTFWFHPHLRASEQVERGLFGVLVVEDAEPLPYSRDEVWVLDDWLLDADGQIAAQFNTRHDLAHDGRWGNVVTVNATRGLALAVKAGERIRLRLVNVANGRVFAPDFAGLDAHVIAVDGMYAARPLDPAGYELAPGNRLDVDLTIPSSLRGTRVPITDRFTGRPIPLAEIVVADEVVETPRFPSPARAHVPEWRTAAASLLRAEYRLNARAGGPFGIQWTINDEAFDHDAAHAADHGSGQVLAAGEFSRLRFTNESYRLHPMHVHGQFFKLLSRNGKPVDEPHWRDTVLLHAQETVDVGMVPLDVGRWMLHCHVLEHAEAGMMTTVEVRR